MSNYLKIEGDPDYVSGRGVGLQNLGETFKGKIAGILADIHAVEAEKPWGNDGYGRGFEATYYATPEGFDKPFRTVVQVAMQDAGKTLTTVGKQTVMGMTMYQGEDAEGGRKIKAVEIPKAI